MTGRIRVGVSGWCYPAWRGTFYPKALPERLELAYAARQFSSIEVNATFYRLQRPEDFHRWAAQTPPAFRFALKGSGYITHRRKFLNPLIPLANFFASGVLALGPKLGPVLWQCPPQFAFHPDRLATFFRLLPRSLNAAAELARHHDARLQGRSLTKTPCNRPLRHAIEIRHPSFCSPAFIALLRTHNVGLVVADGPHWPQMMDVTSNFIYCRLHGAPALYKSGYGPRALEKWAERARAWAGGGETDGAHFGPPAMRRHGRDVYLYFDNDVKARAPRDARSLIGWLTHGPQHLHTNVPNST